MNLEKKKVRKAVLALFALLEQNKKNKFIDEAEKINLQFTFKKVPDVKDKSLCLKLPHSMQTSTQDVCLFVKDLNKKTRDYEPTVHHYKDLLETHGVSIVSEVIPLKSLKTEYKPFEAKRVLSDRFDAYLADKCIIRLLPGLLGKHFYGRKRVPIGVKMTAKNLKKEIDQALDNAKCTISGRGSSSMATIAHSEMEPDSVADNVIAAAEQIAAGIPGGPVNIKNLYIKAPDSMAIPIYISSDDGDVVLPAKKRRIDDTKAEEITTLTGGKVKVTAFGEVKIIMDKNQAVDEDLDLDIPTDKKKFKSSNSKPHDKSKKKLPQSSKSKTLQKRDVKRKGVKQPLKKPKKPLKSKS